MLGLVFRGNSESGSKISREVTHGAIVPWAWAGDASLVRRIKSTRQARVPPVCGSARPSSLPAQLGLGLPHLLRLISNFLFAGDREPGLAFCASRVLLGHHLPPVAVARRMWATCRLQLSGSGRKAPDELTEPGRAFSAQSGWAVGGAVGQARSLPLFSVRRGFLVPRAIHFCAHLFGNIRSLSTGLR